LGAAVDRRSVAVKAEADSWQAAVELCGELLAAAEVVEERYWPVMIWTVEVLGPYMDVARICCPPASPVDDSTCGKGRLRTVTVGEMSPYLRCGSFTFLHPQSGRGRRASRRTPRPTSR
jgi:hypothetical protein